MKDEHFQIQHLTCAPTIRLQYVSTYMYLCSALTEATDKDGQRIDPHLMYAGYIHLGLPPLA